MVGIINCFKPEGISSFGVIKHLRKILGTKKIGHSGTLDPIATGVLPVFIGKATRLIEYQNELSKVYRAEIIFGARTDTQDRCGNIIEEKSVMNIKSETLLSLFMEFTGEIQQIPPMYSAIKHKGVKLYNLARKGIEVIREPRKINIYKLSLLDYVDADKPGVLFEVECSSGTYVRTLCEDMGLKLGCGAYLNSLVRVRAGSFHLSFSNTLEEISAFKEKGEYEKFLLPMDFPVKHMNSVVILPEYEYMILNGRKIQSNQIANKLDNLLSEQKVCIYNNKNELMAVAEVTSTEGEIFLKPLKVLAGQ